MTVFVILAVNNRQIVAIDTFPLPYGYEARLFMVMIFFFLFGFLVGMVLYSKNFFDGRIVKKKIRRKRKRR